MQLLPAGQDRVAGPPGLHTALRHRISGGQVVLLLEGTADLHSQSAADLPESVTYDLIEVLFNILPDYEHDLPEACLHGIMNGVIDNDRAIGAHRAELLYAAPESRTYTGCHNN